MSRKVSTPVSVKTIRAAFHDGTLKPAEGVSPASVTPGARGRINPAHVAVYVEANPGTTYAEKTAEAKTVSLPLVSPKTGRPIKPVVVTISEARALAGVEGKRGRLGSASLAKAAEAYQAKA